MDASTLIRLRRNRALTSNTYTKVPGVPSEVVMERRVGNQAFFQDKKLVQECCNPPEINYYNPFQINFFSDQEAPVTVEFGCKGYIELILLDLSTFEPISSTRILTFNSPSNTFTYTVPAAGSGYRYILYFKLESTSTPLTDVIVSGTSVRRITSLGVSTPGVYNSLDVSGCPNLVTLDIQGSKNLTSVILGDPKLNLSSIFASESGITTLNASGCSALTRVEVLGCITLSGLIVDNCTSLLTLGANNCTSLNDVNIGNCNPAAVIDLRGTGFTTATANTQFANYLLAGPNPATGTIDFANLGIVIVNPSNLNTLQGYGWTIYE